MCVSPVQRSSASMTCSGRSNFSLTNMQFTEELPVHSVVFGGSKKNYIAAVTPCTVLALNIVKQQQPFIAISEGSIVVPVETSCHSRGMYRAVAYPLLGSAINSPNADVLGINIMC